MRYKKKSDLSEWSLTIYLTPYNRKLNVLSASLNKTFPSFPLRHCGQLGKIFSGYITSQACRGQIFSGRIDQLLYNIKERLIKVYYFNHRKSNEPTITNHSRFVSLFIIMFTRL